MASNFFSEHKTIFVHTIVVSVLVAICSWNIYYIVDEFINDNRLTIVKIESVNQTFPILKNIPVTLEYYTSALFPELWPKEAVSPRAVEQEFLQKFTLNASFLEDRINSGLLFRQLELLDEHIYACVLDPNAAEFGYCDAMPSFSKFDAALQNKTFMESLQESVWSDLKNRLIASVGTPEEISGVSYSYFTHYGAHVEIDAHALLTRQAPAYDFFAGLVGTDQERMKQILNQTKTEIRVKLSVQDFAAGPFTLYNPKENTKRTTMVLNIENIGVYDRSLTTPCDSEPEIYMPFYEKTCKSRSFLKAVAKKCHCQPFSLRKKAAKLSTFSDSLPFCTSAMYDQCKADLQKIDEECLPSCVNVKNQYSITTTVEKMDNYYCTPFSENLTTCGVAYFQIGCGISDYAVYEERIKVSPTQFVAQIGGDIGIYIGLSALGIWQFVISLFREYQKHKEEAKQASRRLSKKKIARKTLVAALVGDFVKEKTPDDVAAVRENEATAPLLDNDELRQRMENLEGKLIRRVDERIEKFMGDIMREMEAIKNGMADPGREESKATVVD